MKHLLVLIAVTLTAAATEMPANGTNPVRAHPPVRFVRDAAAGRPFSWVDAGIGAAAGAGALLTLTGVGVLVAIRHASTAGNDKEER